MPASVEPTTTKKSRRRTKKISVDEAEAAKNEAVEEAVQKARSEWDSERENEGFEDPDTYETFDEEQGESFILGSDVRHTDDDDLALHNKEAAEWDLFDWIEKQYYSQGIPVIYQIKKDGAVQGQLEHPCSWAMLQETYGGGHYQVIAKSAVDKQYIKSQRQMVRPPVIKTKEDKEERIIMPPPQEPSLDMNQMFTGMMGMFQQMQEMTEKGRTREDREEKKSMDTFNTTFLTLMQNQQQSTQAMFMEMQKMNTEMMKSISENFSKSQEKMDDKFTKMFDKMADNQTKKENISTMDLITLMNNSRKDGIDTMQTVLELAEAKADAMADREPDSKDSLLATLVKGFSPILAQANKSMQQANQQPYAGGQPRGSVPPRQPQIPQTAQPGVPQGGRTPQGQPPQRRAQPSQGPGPVGGRSPENITAGALGLPSFSDKGAVRRPEPVIDNTINADFIEEIEAEGRGDTVNPRGDDLYQKANQVQQTIAEIAVPTIALYIGNDEIKPTDVAHICLSECAEQGFTPDVVNREFTFDFMLQIAQSFGIGDEKRAWFEEFYATIQDVAGDEPVGEEELTLS